MDSSSQGAKVGAFQPPVPPSPSKVTCTPYGGARSSASRRALAARAGSVVGANRNESLQLSSGNNTLPADPTGGRPSAPVTARVARQVLLMISSTGSLDIGRTPGAQGTLPATLSP